MSTGVRYYVYDIRTQMEDFVASFADHKDAREFAVQRFGDHGVVTMRSLHEKTTKIGKQKAYKR